MGVPAAHRGWKTHTRKANDNRLNGSWAQKPVPTRTDRALLADAELGNNGFIPFRVVLLQVIEQATTLADQHEKSAAGTVVFLVRFEVVRQLTDPLAEQCDLDFRGTGIGGMRAVRVNNGLLLLSG